MFDPYELFITTKAGCIEVRNKAGQLHNTCGPAIIDTDGSHIWYYFGKLHREDGPAIIDTGGFQAWFVHGKLDRRDGPAVIWSDGREYWYR